MCPVIPSSAPIGRVTSCPVRACHVMSCQGVSRDVRCFNSSCPVMSCACQVFQLVKHSPELNWEKIFSNLQGFYRACRVAPPTVSSYVSLIVSFRPFFVFGTSGNPRATLHCTSLLLVSVNTIASYPVIHTVVCHVMLCHIVSCHSYRSVSCHALSYLIMSFIP